MDILVFCGDPGVPIHGPSGASVHLRQIARAFAALGHSVTVGALLAHDRRGRHDVPLGLPSVTVGRTRWRPGLRSFGERVDAWRLARRLGGRHFDLIYERFSLHCDAGLALARRRGIPHILELNAPLSLERGRRSRVEAKVLRETDVVIAVSPWLGRWAEQRGARQVRVVPNGSDLRPAGPPAPGLGLIHHGSLRPWHGMERSIAILDALPEATLDVIGGRPAVEHPRLRWWPVMEPPALARLISRASVALLPYPPDAPPWFDPLKLHDYRAVGVPVVGTLHPACAAADLRVQWDDIDGWVAAIRDLAGRRNPPRPRPWTDVARAILSAGPGGTVTHRGPSPGGTS